MGWTWPSSGARPRPRGHRGAHPGRAAARGAGARRPGRRQARVGLRDLDPRGLRHPARDSDPPTHDAILAVLPVAQVRPPAGDMRNVLFEVGREPEGWTLIPARQPAGSRSDRVCYRAARPADDR